MNKLKTSELDSPLGKMRVIASDTAIYLLEFINWFMVFSFNWEYSLAREFNLLIFACTIRALGKESLI